MDLDTFLTTLYVFVDDWYKVYVLPHKPKTAGAPPRMSDSEVLTAALVGQWRVGVPWQSERGLVRYLRAHGRGWFPTMLGRSAFNERVRSLWGAFILLQQAVADLLHNPADLYECVDCEPLPAMSNSQALNRSGHWLWESTAGHGGTSGGFFTGDHVLAVVSATGAVTGWLLANADIQDRWLFELVLSSRAGCPQLGVPERRPKKGALTLPMGHLGPVQAAGRWSARPYLADAGYNGQHWLIHWRTHYRAIVFSPPQPNEPTAWPPDLRTWFSGLRQRVETVFACLDTVFGLKQLNAHSRWGQYTRVAAKMAACNIGQFINCWLGRPRLALATLIC
jgi:hypothetical protein